MSGREGTYWRGSQVARLPPYLNESARRRVLADLLGSAACNVAAWKKIMRRHVSFQIIQHCSPLDLCQYLGRDHRNQRPLRILTATNHYWFEDPAPFVGALSEFHRAVSSGYWI